MNKKFKNKSLSTSSKQWLQRQNYDFYTKSAKSSNYRSRAAFKLIQILEQDQLIKPGQTIADLGAAPGSWSQVAASLVGGEGQIFAIDLLPINSINRVETIKADVLDLQESNLLEKKLRQYYPNKPNHKFDGILSDLSPKISGIRAQDNAKSLELWQLALRLSMNHLKLGGFFICKLFQSIEADEFINHCHQHFEKTKIRKPRASRNESREIYLVAKSLYAQL